MKKKSVIFSVLLSFSLLVTACSSQSAQSPAGQSGSQKSELVVAAEQEPVGLDPNKVPAASSTRIYSLIYDSLTRMDESFAVQPSLADKWTWSDNGKTLTFDLHQGVKFHNGREFTSDDVKYTYERILNKDEGALARSNFKSIESIETPDKYKVVFKLKQPDTAFLANAASSFASIVPKEVKDLNKEAVGTGPFMLDKIEPGQSVTLKKNPDFYGQDKPKVDQITFRIMKDEAERIAALRAGKIDLTMVTSESSKLLENTKNVSLKNYQSMEYGYIGMNVAKKPFDDVRVRQAIAYAVNRDEIIKTVWKGFAVPSGPVSPAQKATAIDVSAFPSYSRNIEKAKQLLKEAGYENGFTTVIQTEAMYQDLVDSAQVVQQQLKQIGINTEIQKMEEGAYVELWKSKKMDMMIGRNSSGTNPDRSLRFFFATDGTANVWNYSNPEYDKLVYKALETTDDNQRKEIYAQAQKMVVEDSPNVFLTSPTIFYAVNDRVKDFVPTAVGESVALKKASVNK